MTWHAMAEVLERPGVAHECGGVRRPSLPFLSLSSFLLQTSEVTLPKACVFWSKCK